MKILMPVDDSNFSVAAAQAVIVQFRSENTEIRVLHVLQPVAPAPPQMSPGYAPELDDQKPAANELVERIAKHLSDGGFKADCAVKVGDIRETIIDSAAEWNADVIVMGSHGQSGIRRFLLGGVTEFVARHAGCSVEIVRKPASR
jgi:nucleotide-binding universal stress UspA family protein